MLETLERQTINLGKLQEQALLITNYKQQELRIRNLSPLTEQKYLQGINSYLRWLEGKPITLESAKEFLIYLKDKGYSPRSLELYYHALKPFLEYLDIPLRIKFRKQKKLPPYVKPEHVRAIIRCAYKRKDNWAKSKKDRDILILTLLASTGMRRSELLRLRVSDVRNDGVVLVRGKGNKERIIPLPVSALSMLRDYIAEMQFSTEDRIFPLSPSRFNVIVRRYGKLAGLKGIHPHLFRHFYCTQLLENGANMGNIIVAAKELLGHSDINTTAQYAELLQMHLRKAVDNLPDITNGLGE